MTRLGNLVRGLFAPAAERAMRRALPAIRRGRAGLQALSDAELARRAGEIRRTAPDSRAAAMALALACEAARRGIGLDPHDTQVQAALFLKAGAVVEMATGEGKTLAAALAASASALAGRCVHVVTANDYLAARDAAWMAPVYGALGLTVGCRQRGQSQEERRAAHANSIVYGTAAEFAFDYLMDGLRTASDGAVCRAHDFAIVDEADQILIDESMNPIVLTADIPADAAACAAADAFVLSLSAKDVEINTERREAVLSEAGHRRAEAWFAETAGPAAGSLFDVANLGMANRIRQALQARHIMVRERDYVVQDGAVVVLDARTGRTTRGRFPEGLHQALEVREGVPLSPGQMPLASLSMGAFGKLYRTLSGMTGTAMADAPEFAEVYGLGVAPIPLAVPSRRAESADRIFATAQERLDAMLTLVGERHARGQPVLIGTTTIAKLEALSADLSGRGIPHRVLHAHFAAEEAAIIAEAGRQGAVTVATNMAGRGTDIELGGPRNRPGFSAEERAAVLAAGGLLVVGSERQGLRRIDDQLRGRAGRRGDAGEAAFFVSLEDDVVAPIRGAQLARLVERSPREADGRLLDPTLPQMVAGIQAKNLAKAAAERKAGRGYNAVLDGQAQAFRPLREKMLVPADPSQADLLRAGEAAAEFAGIDRAVAGRLRVLAPGAARAFCHGLLKALDLAWQEHVIELDMIRQSVGWRGLGGRDPLIEFGAEGLAGFDRALDRARALFRAAFESLPPR